ncbi:MAG TPA: hypothetical protein VK789_28275 [Bryobacteraceae bacterium]|nr:hypothetical protein [Bryobacteraceae bacterium]
MAICENCKQEMTTADGCTADRIQFTPDGKKATVHDRNRYGKETRYPPPDPGRRCHDCGVSVGQFHHPGCDVEECPRCCRQLLSCPCNDEGMFADLAPTGAAK